MADIKLELATAVDLTINLTDLTESPTFVDGRESLAVDNTTTKYLDFLLGGEFRTDTTGLSAGVIRVYLWGSIDDTNIPNPFAGTDSDVDLVYVERLGVACRLFEELPTNTTVSVDYAFSAKGIASYFGGSLPLTWGAYVTHDTGSDLTSGTLTHTGVIMTSE